MDSDRIRRSFVDFFTARDHVHRPSASLIPTDPTLLLTNAGMVPFKPYFLAEEEPPFARAVSVQKCARTIDIDIIGTTHRHLSFFEMLGNFSFGDYFKTEAIAWANELVTEGFGLDPDRLWYTVHDTDDDARDIWIDDVGIPSERVQRGGKDNFWQMGVPGPCGPCSEIFYDKGPEYGEPGGPIGGGEERFVEVWNLVFMQNIQDEPYHVVGELPAKNIDTGMGLERIAGILQGVDSVFEVDAIRPILAEAEAATGVAYGAAATSDVSLRILADHARSMTMLIADGVVPSNEGRGYVLRRLIRRAVRHAWQLSDAGLVTPRLSDTVITTLGDAYPDLVAKRDLVLGAVEAEEGRFRRTLESGHQLLDAELAGKDRLPGDVAFRLHDTYGFPIELTTEVAAERGVEVDRPGFDEEMQSQRQRARKAWRGGDAAVTAQLYGAVLDEVGPTAFTGYEVEAGPARVLAIMADGELVEQAEAGRTVELFFDRTPFYAERGGQIGDSGTATSPTGSVAIADTRHALPGLHGHHGTVERGTIMVGQEVDLVIDSVRRERIRKSHTGTHLLHWGVRDVLGTHAQQAGSLVEPGRLRFDFSHFGGVDPDELDEIERRTNTKIIENEAVEVVYTTKEEADRMGALAFFGERYGDTVRVVKVGEYSVELCGGTHARSAGQVGPLIVLSESSIGSNMRRIDALTGDLAYQHLAGWRRGLTEAGSLLKAPPAEVPERVRSLLAKVEELEDTLGTYRARDRKALAGDVADAATTVGSVPVVVAPVPDLDPNGLRQLALEVRDRLGSGVVVLGSVAGPKGFLVGAVSKDLAGDRIAAHEVVAAGAGILGGGGNRDPELAQAGGPKGEALGEALDAVRAAIADALG